MKHCYDPKAPKAFIDVETQSEQPLDTVDKYVSHPSTRVLTCVVKHDGRITKMGPYLTSDNVEFLDKLSETHVFVAHNAPFDSAVLERVLGLPECEWWDTLPTARAAGLPGRLDDLGKALDGRGKDPNGKRLLDLLCILRPGQKPPAPGPAHQLLLDYNTRDVHLLELVYERTKEFVEPELIAVDHAINRRGVPIRADLLCKLRAMYSENAERMSARFAEVTGDVNPNSPKQVKEWLGNLGFVMPGDSIGKNALRDFMAKPDDCYTGDDPDGICETVELIKEAMEARREVVRVGKGKADACLAGLSADSRLREQFVYWGAHTGRWSGRGMQLHNMPALSSRSVDTRKVDFTLDAMVRVAAEASAEALAKGEPKVLVADVLGACLRRLVEADNLLVADYGAVEARCVAWMTGCKRMLALYADPKQSVYIDMGRTIFGRTIDKKKDAEEYRIAKDIVLGCGYGMSGAKFEIGCKLKGASLGAMIARGISGRDAVRIYRETYPEVPAGWDLMGDAAMRCAREGADTSACKCRFTRSGSDMHMVLPSGRRIVYRDVRVEMLVPAYCALYGMPLNPVPTITYTFPRGWRSFLYGAKLVENADQAMCRDLVADALMRCEKDGLRPTLHVHDEIGCQASDDGLEHMMRIMTQPPEWADGFPVLVEGYSGPIWSKCAKGYREVNMLRGEVV